MDHDSAYALRRGCCGCTVSNQLPHCPIMGTSIHRIQKQNKRVTETLVVHNRRPLLKPTLERGGKAQRGSAVAVEVLRSVLVLRSLVQQCRLTDC